MVAYDAVDGGDADPMLDATSDVPQRWQSFGRFCAIIGCVSAILLASLLLVTSSPRRVTAWINVSISNADDAEAVSRAERAYLMKAMSGGDGCNGFWDGCAADDGQGCTNHNPDRDATWCQEKCVADESSIMMRRRRRKMSSICGDAAEHKTGSTCICRPPPAPLPMPGFANWSFCGATIVLNNLDGADQDKPQQIRYQNVGTYKGDVLDLVVTPSGYPDKYVAGDASMNKIIDCYAVINTKTSTGLWWYFYKTGTDTKITSPDVDFFLSVSDLEQSASTPGRYDLVGFGINSDIKPYKYYVARPTALKIGRFPLQYRSVTISEDAVLADQLGVVDAVYEDEDIVEIPPKLTRTWTAAFSYGPYQDAHFVMHLVVAGEGDVVPPGGRNFVFSSSSDLVPRVWPLETTPTTTARPPTTTPKSTTTTTTMASLEWSFCNVKVKSNLGGTGPDTNAPEEIRFFGVADGIDLKVTGQPFDGEPYSGDVTMNKVVEDDSGCYAIVNIGGGMLGLDWQFVNSGTDDKADVLKFDITIGDLDGSGAGISDLRNKETLMIGPGLTGYPASFEVLNGTSLTMSHSIVPSMHDIVIFGGTKGVEDNKSDDYLPFDLFKTAVLSYNLKPYDPGHMIMSIALGDDNRFAGAGRNFVFKGGRGFSTSVGP